jgi:superfamily II DNA/RNA helicase
MTPRSRQTTLFSATTPDWVHRIASKHLVEPEVITSEKLEEEAPDIEQLVMEVFREDKFQVLTRLLRQPVEGTTVVFGRTKHGVRNLGRKLEAQGFRVSVLQGNLGQNQRDQQVERFRSGKTDILVATNVAARGLDILHIARVINYDIPDSLELFTHRVGRTGRMGRSGEAITLVAAVDLTKLQEIERGLGRKLPRVTGSQAMSGERPVATAPVAKPVSSFRLRRGWGRRRVRA